MSSDTNTPTSAPAKAGPSPLLPVDEALARVLAGAGPCGHESVRSSRRPSACSPPT